MIDFARILARTGALARNLLHRRRSDVELDEELRGYVDGLTAEHMRRGMTQAEAARAARLELGGVDVVTENVRDVRAGAVFERVARDFRFAARSLRKTPVFTITAVLALALGIGATTSILSVVRAVLLRPLAYADADRLVVILLDGRNPTSPANFVHWRAQTRSFADMAAAEYWTPDQTGGDDPTAVAGLRITTGMLPMLGVPPVLGRVFSVDEDQPGHDQELILSYGFWRRRFGGNRDVVGKTMSLDGKVFTIVGVMPKPFQFAPFWMTRAEVWAPLALAQRMSDGQSLRVFARLAPGVTLAQARADLDAVTTRLERENPGTNKNVMITPLKEKVVGDIRMSLLVLFVAVGFVLLIACANVAHMLLARAATRYREVALRAAIGASRTQLIVQMLVESTLLALVGGAGGLALAGLGVRGLVAAGPAIIPRVATVTIDGGVLLMTLGITAFTVIVFGLLPAIRSTRVDLAETFRDGDRGSSEGRGRGRLRGALVASEFALALVLLVGAGLMIRSFIALQHVDPGFDPRNVVSMIVSTSGTPAAEAGRHQDFYVQTLDRVGALPNVISASYINHRPFDGDLWGFPFWVEGRPRPKPGESPTATYRVVFPGYFATMRIPILAGRDVAETDRVGTAGVVVINEFMAKRHWPGESALGKRIAVDDSSLLTVVGVVKNDVRGEWAAQPEEEMFLPFFQRPRYVAGLGASRTVTLVARVACARTECDASELTKPIREAIRSVERNAPISAVTTMSALVASATAESGFYLALLVAFASIAVALAAVGIYGVMSYSVSRRTHEIGIRIALGAEGSSVMQSVVVQGASVAAAGAAAGLVAAFGLTRMMRGILYGVSPTDPRTFVAVTVLLFGVAILASLVPARRATRVDPLVALRAE
jgi:putative ABC transport system permease protein